MYLATIPTTSWSLGWYPPFLGDDPGRPDLEISGTALTSYDWAFTKTRGKRFKALVEKVAAAVRLNPGLLGENLISEAVPAGRGVYLKKGKVFSAAVGADVFYETFFIRSGASKGSLKKSASTKVPAVKKIKFASGWDPKNPPIFENEKGNNVESAWFASGKDATLGHAALLKFFEERLREEAVAARKDFDALPAEVRFFLARLRFNPGRENWKDVLAEALDGKDVLAKTGRDRPKWPSIRRAATVHAARALHLSAKVFGLGTP